LIVDEAQNLSHKVLEEIRLLSGIESQKEKPLRIILAGQPELNDKLDSLRLEQLRQRVRLRFHLTTLSKRETAEYVQHRLDVAGANGRKIFDKDSLDLVYRYAGGVPRLINVLCDTAMLCGFSEGKDTIDVGLINEAVNELQWVEYDKRFENRGKFSASHAPQPAARRLRLVDVHVPRFAEPEVARALERRLDEDDEPAPIREPVRQPQPLVAAERTPARFEVLFKEQHITDFALPLGRTVVGRTGDNDLQIRSRFVSRHHIQIITEAESSRVEDLNSTNGMFIHGQKVQHHVLADGDAIQLGEHKLVYRDMRTAADFSSVLAATPEDDTIAPQSLAEPAPSTDTGDTDSADDEESDEVFAEFDGAETRVLD
jgi:pSer/pThr/pTyr-binding forkhead associated (FHA) protein